MNLCTTPPFCRLFLKLDNVSVLSFPLSLSVALQRFVMISSTLKTICAFAYVYYSLKVEFTSVWHGSLLYVSDVWTTGASTAVFVLNILD